MKRMRKMSRLQRQYFSRAEGRKNQLFFAFQNLVEENEKTLGLSPQNTEILFEQFYEGLATPVKNRDDDLVLRLEDGSEIQPVSGNADVLKHLKMNADEMYLEVGFLHGRWWIMHVVSIATILNCNNQEHLVHFSVNPRLIQN